MATTSQTIDDQADVSLRRVDTPVAPPRTEKHDPGQTARARRRRLWAVLGAVVCGSLLLAAGLTSLRSNAVQAGGDYVYATVQRTDLPITVTERGTIESQNNVQIICEVEDVQGDGINGTPILWIVENGVSVKKGDLLVDLDSAPHLERLDRQILDTETARAKAIQASVNHENRISRNETAEAKAELEVKLAELALQQYEDEHGGTFQIELQDVELSIQEQEAQKEIDQRNVIGMKQLTELGYKSRGDLAEAELRAQRAETAYKREMARRFELMTYEYRKMKATLEGKLASAKRTCELVKNENEALLAQALAWKESAQMSLDREEERLARYREQLKKCKIYSPQSGMVAYTMEDQFRGQAAPIKAGTAVRERQPLMSIPDLSRMQVKTSIHESVVDRVKPGLATTIRLDAFPDRTYQGTVESVAVLPDAGNWLSADTKVYETIVTIDQEVEHLKPGMTAVAEIHIDYLSNVLSVPVQAIVQRGNNTWCYVAEAGRLRRQDVTLGQTNDKFVQVCDGLNQGDQLVLNPSAVLGDAAEEPHSIGPDAQSAE